MNRLFKFLLLLSIISCQDQNAEVQGVWFTSDSSHFDMHYFEAHVTDSAFAVVSDVQLSYLATYEQKGDTLIQYLRDIYNEFEVLDTNRFILTTTQDTMKLVTAINPYKTSTWTRIPHLEPFDFFGTDSLDQFVIELKKRYRKNYLDIYEPQNVEGHLQDFDVYWIENK